MKRGLGAVERIIACRVLAEVEDAIERYKNTLEDGHGTVMINVFNSGVYVNATEAAIKTSVRLRDVVAGIRLFYTTK